MVDTAAPALFSLPPRLDTVRPPLPPGGGSTQNRPHAVGSVVEHASFGRGKVMGYQGEQKILVHFGLVTFIGNIDWSINVPGKHASDAKYGVR